MTTSIVTTIYILFPAIIFCVLIFSASYILEAWKKVSCIGKRSPLKGYKLWRGPGESLREKIDDCTSDIFVFMAITPVTLLIYSPIYYAQLFTATQGKPISLNLYFSIVLNGLMIIYCLWRIIKAWTEKHNYLLGLDGETYVGQQLNHLMLLGCRVYHDFQTAKQGNIDHIVVSPSGVFAVETKGRYKPDKDRGTVDAKVVFDGNNLKFSDVFQTDQPLKQARGLANTLSQVLSSSAGDKVPVTPVVALPGWYVDLKAPPKNIKITNGKLVDDTGQVNLNKMSNSFYVKPERGGTPLSESLFTRVVDVLDKECRNLEPLAYRK